MTLQGFKCESVEDLHLLAADMNEGCPVCVCMYLFVCLFVRAYQDKI